MKFKLQTVMITAVLVVAAALVAATTASARTAGYAASLGKAGATAPTAAHSVASPRRANGNFTWWGYRTNSYETWAVATQSPSFWVSWVPIFGQYVTWQARVWRLTAQNARMMGRCLGITWSGSGIIVGCSRS
jgi:hypothetical protein